MNVPSSAPSYPYPGVRAGGLFLLIVGIGLVAGGLLGTALMFPVFLGGFGLGFIALGVFSGALERPLGKATLVQNLMIPAAILLEVVLVAGVFRLFPNPGSREFILAILFVVGVHFLPFAVRSGPLMLAVAGLCCANALVGWFAASIPIAVLWTADGAIKAIIGIAMLRAPLAYLRERQAGSATAARGAG